MSDLHCKPLTSCGSQSDAHKVMSLVVDCKLLIQKFDFWSWSITSGWRRAPSDAQIANRAETTITILLNNGTRCDRTILLIDTIDSNRLFVRRTLKIVWMAVNNPFSRFARNSKGIVKGENASLKTLYWRVFTEDILLSYWRHSIALQKTLFSSPLVSITKRF